MYSYAVFDLETKKAIPGNIIDPTIEYCKGWTDYVGMGISVGSLYYNSVGYVFDDIDFLYKKLKWFQNRGIFVGGYNTKKFDDKLLTANGYPFVSDFDLLEFVRSKVGYFKKGYTLRELSEKNGLEKVGDGGNAPKLYQNGEMYALQQYALNDAKVTYDLVVKHLNRNLIL